MIEPKVPERQGLESSFMRARWLAAIALTVLLPVSGAALASTAGLVALIGVMALVLVELIPGWTR